MVYRDEKSWASLKRFSFLFCFVPSVSGMNSVLSTSPKCLFRMQEVRKEPITQMPTFTLNEDTGLTQSQQKGPPYSLQRDCFF